MRVHGTHLRCEGSEGSEGSKGSEGKVDDPSGRGLWPPAGGRLCPHRGNDSLHFVRRSAPSKCVRCASLRSGRAAPAALRVADCPSRAMLIKSALRDSLPVSYSMISILVISRYAAPPYPAAPDFHLKVKPFYTTLGTKGRRPDGCHRPLCAAGAGPFGNTGKHRPGPGPDRPKGACPYSSISCIVN